MKLLSRILMLSAVFAGFSFSLAAIEIVPQPTVMKETRSLVRIPEKLTLHAADKALQQVAETYISSVGKPFAPGTHELSTGFTRIVSDVELPSMKLVRKAGKAFVALSLDQELAEEEYTLEVDQSGIAIAGGSEKGVWWGLQTLTQILVQSAEAAGDRPMVTSGLYIQDKPHFSYRGAMLDCCRHFFSVDEVKTFIDMMAVHKLNVFHWHLTEDQGWRIEIEKYPKLTEIGSVRKETLVGHMRKDHMEFDGTPYGGFYTKKDIREIVAYAAERMITIIPEIDIPGHAVAALASYPEFGCTGGPYEVRTMWGISKDVLCLGKPETIQFLKDVFDEVCELFPGEYIHIGGDEAPSVRWENCPDCQALMKKEGYTNARQLQFYLLHQIEPYINSKGKKIIGWDEILEGGVTPTATIMSWRGPKGGIQAAKQGNNVVMSPNSHFYLDYYQTTDPEGNHEPLAIGGKLPLSKCLSFDPYDQLTESEKQYIVGVQANTWTEYMPNFDHVQHMDLPRFAALSEVAWSESNKSEYNEFNRRVKNALLPVYQYFGFVYAPYEF